MVRNAVDLTMARLLADVSAGIRVLKSRDGLPLSETQIRERAHNIVMGLLINYRLESLEDENGAPVQAEPSDHAFENEASVTGQG